MLFDRNCRERVAAIVVEPLQARRYLSADGFLAGLREIWTSTHAAVFDDVQSASPHGTHVRPQHSGVLPTS